MGKWKEEEIRFLLENYRNMTYREIGQLIGKSEHAVKQKARSLGLKKVRHWSEEEESFLIENYDYLGLEICAKILKRTEKSVYMKARELEIVDNHNGDKAFPKYLKPIIELVNNSEECNIC